MIFLVILTFPPIEKLILASLNTATSLVNWLLAKTCREWNSRTESNSNVIETESRASLVPPEGCCFQPTHPRSVK